MVLKKYDVIVAGLGTTGAISLITCAKLGLKVLGVERINQMGGTGTAGGIGSYYLGSKGGIYEDINKKSKDIQREYFKEASYLVAGAKSVALEQEAVKHGAEFWYNSHIISVKCEQNKVKGVTVFKDGKEYEAECKILIDCTANCDILSMAGCEFRVGRSFDSVTQPYTNSFFVANPTARVENRDAGHIDMNNNKEYSKQLLFANTREDYLLDFYDTEDKIYLQSSPISGIREGRLLVGEETVTFEDAVNRKKQDKTVFYAFSNADSHEKGFAFEDEEIGDFTVASGLWGTCMSVAIPIGCLIPKGFDGLLAGGRHISVTHNIASAVRMKSDMEKCGEAVAFTAYLAIKHNCKTKDVPYAELKELLTETGALDEQNDVGFLNRTKEGNVPFEFPKTIEELRENLSEDNAGQGIYFAKNIENSARFLEKWQNEEGLFGINSALSLGVMGEISSLDKLISLAENRCMYIPKTSMKMNYTIGMSAVYLLGKLKDKRAVPVLKEIIEDKGKFNTDEFVQNEMFACFEDVSFQFVTFALISLIKIGMNNPDLKEDVSEFLKEKFVLNLYPLKITSKANAKCKIMLDYSCVASDFVKKYL